MRRRLAAGGVTVLLLVASSSLLANPSERRDGGFSVFEADSFSVPPFSATALSDAAFAAISRLERRGYQAVAGDYGFTAVARALGEPFGSSSRRTAPPQNRGIGAVEQTSQEAALSDGFDDAFGGSATGLRGTTSAAAQTRAEAGLQSGFEDDGFGGGDSLSSGFDDFPSADIDSALGPEELGPANASLLNPDNSFYDLSGSFTFGAAYNYAQDSPESGEADYQGLSRLRFGLDLELDLELPLGLSARVAGRGFRDSSYSLKDKDEFSHEVLQLYESELEFKELYLQGTVGEKLDFRVGRQVLAWGSSETLRVLDVLSPLDNREPGLVDLRDLRLPVAATKVSYFSGPFRLTGIAIHESRFDETPPFGSDFFPFEERLPGEVRPANGGSDTEYAVALTGRFASFDASLNWAQYFDDEPHLDRDSGLLEHSRLNLIGASADVPLGNFLVRGEVARVRGLEFFGSRGKLGRSDALLGIEYSGLSDKAITLELVARKLHGYDDRILDFPDGQRENSFEGSLRYTANYLNDRARLTALFIVFGQQAQDGTTLRVTFDYDLRDAFTIGGGILLFEEGDLPPFNAIDKNDRVFINLRYSF